MAAPTAVGHQTADGEGHPPALIGVGVVVTEGLQWVAGHLVVLDSHLLVGSGSAQLLNVVPAAGADEQTTTQQAEKSAGGEPCALLQHYCLRLCERLTNQPDMQLTQRRSGRRLHRRMCPLPP